jgi:hypothetical protein
VICVPSSIVKQARDNPIAVASELPRQLDEVLGKLFSSGKPQGALLCVDRCCPSVRPTGRSDPIPHA